MATSGAIYHRAIFAHSYDSAAAQADFCGGLAGAGLGGCVVGRREGGCLVGLAARLHHTTSLSSATLMLVRK